ncbi:MAG: tryptophan 2,3-dioxygenase [Proteobacteria bacterium]|nr:tryptophan 2,3-dioxygenase [Pseudomonadota bacterium]
MDYGDYLKLAAVRSAHAPLTGEHDELLFIVIHQATELWLKLAIHELIAARRDLAADDLRPAFKGLSRVARIQAGMIQAWEILATMTPADYAHFRDRLGSSSGFQSGQYRQLEFLLGAKDARHLQSHPEGSAQRAALEDLLAQPSLYDEALRLLARRGFAIPADHLRRDWRQPYEASPDVEAAWLAVYRDSARYWDLYELGEKLVDLDYRLQQWRFTHMKTVERIIGFKRGTGGSEGVNYLARALERRLFPELLDLRTAV